MRMPAQMTRAAITETTVIVRPVAARGDSPMSPTSTAKLAKSPTISRTRSRPCARFAHRKLMTFDSAGAPLTKATARLTVRGSARPSKPFLTSTAAVAPSTRPSVKPIRPQERISRR